jgi:hypothetical protein
MRDLGPPEARSGSSAPILGRAALVHFSSAAPAIAAVISRSRSSLDHFGGACEQCIGKNSPNALAVDRFVGALVSCFGFD